ncbi:MAG: TonB-dependent receptor [Bacteroidales bacterium]|nr:TonB-dependent receptor [Bacteroidales bacterium]
MKRIISYMVMLFFVQSVIGQVRDTSSNDSVIMINEVVVTATRTERKLVDVPGQVDLIKSAEIENFPVNNIDDILKSVANVYVNRSWGVYSKNSSVTMRGLESSDRTLVLIDGVPKNKLSGGPVNWHSINPDNVDRIEILKGPGSTLYGNNAMGGVINIITRKPTKNLQASLKAFGGQYNTFGGSVNLMGSEIENQKGFYWTFNGIYRQGDGYIFELPENRDVTDVQTYLKEYGAGTKLGYQLNKSNSIEFLYDYYDEIRGAGRQVFVETGSYNMYITNQAKIRYIRNYKNSKFQALIYYQQEDYSSVKESLNDYNEYKLSEATSDKRDKGTWITWSKEIFNKHFCTFGGEVKFGDVIGDEIYRTSPDIINYNGFMSNYALFFQDEMSFFENKFKVVFGVRNDLIRFISGEQEIIDPSKATGFTESFYESFNSNQWNAISPKLSIQYTLDSQSNIYVSYGTGIKPPKLDDLCKTGKINKGFRIANPNLKPETLSNYEIGYNRVLFDNIFLNTALYYSNGEDFQYLGGTGDSIDTGGSELKPVLYRENVSQVRVLGSEISLKYKINKNIFVAATYSYNNSIILKYNTTDSSTLKDLTGLHIVEVSPHLFYSSINWRNKYFSLHINCNYTDSQWADDENTFLIEDYFLTNLKLSKELFKTFNVYIDVQNIFDVEYIDRKGQVSPGRFMIGGIKYTL